MLGTRLIQARPNDPETKGVVERTNGYLGTSFLPGRHFTSPADFNTELTDWLALTANVRRHATTRLVPAEAPIADRVAMASLPPVAPTPIQPGNAAPTKTSTDCCATTSPRASPSSITHRYTCSPSNTNSITVPGWSSKTVAPLTYSPPC